MINTLNNNNICETDFIEIFRKNAEKTTCSILNNEYYNAYRHIMKMEVGTDRNSAMIHFMNEISKACYDICIFNTPEVIKHLNDTFLTERETKWLIPSDELEKILSDLEANKNYKLNRPWTYSTIQQYLHGKIWVAMMERFRLKFTLSQSKSYFDLAIQEAKNSNRRMNIISEFDSFWQKLKTLTKPYITEIYGVDKELITHFQNIKSKESDSILLNIYFLYYVSINKDDKINTKLRLLYPLYKIVLKDRKWEEKRFLFGNKVGQVDNRDIDKKMWKFVYKR